MQNAIEYWKIELFQLFPRIFTACVGIYAYSVYVKKKNYVYYTCIRELASIQIFTLVPAYNHLSGLSIGQSMICQKLGIAMMNMINLNVLEGVNHTVCYEISMLETYSVEQTRKDYRIRKFWSIWYGFRSIILRISINIGFRFLRF